MSDNEFWNLIEDAWKSVPHLMAKRLETITNDIGYRKIPNQLGESLELAIRTDVYPQLKKVLKTFSKEKSFQFNGILERKLYELDRQDIRDNIDGSDDTFLYARGFVVGMGKEYYDKINNEPINGAHICSEEFAYMTRALYHQLYDDENRLIFEISRESRSNKDGYNK